MAHLFYICASIELRIAIKMRIVFGCKLSPCHLLFEILWQCWSLHKFIVFWMHKLLPCVCVSVYLCQHRVVGIVLSSIWNIARNPMKHITHFDLFGVHVTDPKLIIIWIMTHDKLFVLVLHERHTYTNSKLMFRTPDEFQCRCMSV